MMESRGHATVELSLLSEYLTLLKIPTEGTSRATMSMMGIATFGNGGMWLLRRRCVSFRDNSGSLRINLLSVTRSWLSYR
uniref:Uncharacterized protein n=1 Tax=Brassica oleracea var. oleracea TaxID=109376 RepID=A0A0D3AH06_BRAOL